MEKTVMTRRTTLRLIGGSVAGAALAYMIGGEAQALAAGDEDKGAAPFATVGSIVSASADRLVVAAPGSTVNVIRGNRVRAYAGVLGRVSDFSAFVPGDRVFIQGAPLEDGTISAWAVGSVFHPARAEITSMEGGGIASTTLGRVDLRGNLPDQSSAAGGFAVGDVIEGYSWMDPRSNETYLLVPPALTLASHAPRSG